MSYVRGRCALCVQYSSIGCSKLLGANIKCEKINKNNTINSTKNGMKKEMYLAPSIEVISIEVEKGIANSTVSGSGIFGLGDDANYDDYNNGGSIW